MAALSYLQGESEDRLAGSKTDVKLATSAKDYASKTCKGYKVLELMEKQAVKKFGAVCSNSAAFERVVAHLKTNSGIQKVLACVLAGVRLEGNSESQPGIVELKDLFAEFAKCKAGGAPPGVGAGSPLPAPGVGNLGLPELDPDAAALQQHLALVQGGLAKEDLQELHAAERTLRSIEFFSDKATLLSQLDQYAGKNVTVLLEAPTSRKGILSQNIDLAAEAVKKVQNLATHPRGTINYKMLFSGVMHDEFWTSCAPGC
jgi:hypothetical protein